MCVFNEVNNGLCHLCRSRSHDKFLQRRVAYEENWFARGDLPRWYRTLYNTDSEMLMECYKRGQSGVWCFFHGTGYYESSNSDYRGLINQKKVAMNLIPGEMRGVIAARLEEQRQ